MKYIVTVVLLLATVALAQPAKRDLAAEVSRLQAEVAQQREVLKYLLQDQQQRSSMLLQMLGSRGTTPKPESFDTEPSVAPPVARPTAAPARPAATVSVTGRVVTANGPAANAWVFVADVSGAAKSKTYEIKQQNKSFVPASLVVQRGSQLTFPNLDAVFHDVFSRSPGNTFDIGPIQAGERSKQITLTKPGVVDIFCNFHSRMSAKVLVVPGPHFVATDADGNFRLDGVPPGSHTLSAWAPNMKLTQLAVDATQDKAGLELTLESEGSERAHLNKKGQAYGSYGD